MKSNYNVRTNVWGNMSLYRGATRIGIGWAPLHFADAAVKELRARGHHTVKVAGHLIAHDLGAHEGWKAIFDAATSSSTFKLSAD